MIDDPISKTLNIVPYDPTSDDKKIHNEGDTEETIFQADQVVARGNMYDIIHESMEAVKDLARIASQSQDPETYSALATILRVSIQANKTLLDMADKKRITNNKGSFDQPTNVTNNILAITTSDLQQMLLDQKENMNKKK